MENINKIILYYCDENTSKKCVLINKHFFDMIHDIIFDKYRINYDNTITYYKFDITKIKQLNVYDIYEQDLMILKNLTELGIYYHPILNISNLIFLKELMIYGNNANDETIKDLVNLDYLEIIENDLITLSIRYLV